MNGTHSNRAQDTEQVTSLGAEEMPLPGFSQFDDFCSNISPTTIYPHPVQIYVKAQGELWGDTGGRGQAGVPMVGPPRQGASLRSSAPLQGLAAQGLRAQGLAAQGLAPHTPLGGYPALGVTRPGPTCVLPSWPCGNRVLPAPPQLDAACLGVDTPGTIQGSEPRHHHCGMVVRAVPMLYWPQHPSPLSSVPSFTDIPSKYHSCDIKSQKGTPRGRGVTQPCSCASALPLLPVHGATRVWVQGSGAPHTSRLGLMDSDSRGCAHCGPQDLNPCP